MVVDDGSGPAFVPIFEQLVAEYGCEVLRHDRNRGKGATLKTAAVYIAAKYPGKGFVTADADYQHLPQDIFRTAQALEENPRCLVLGTRDFSAPAVPRKSRWGNRITSAVFRLVTSGSCTDTQTGLRGIPAEFVEDCVRISGDRFEYEMNVLLYLAHKIPFLEIPVSTVYQEGNRASHFRPVRDSIYIYLSIFKTFLKFGCSSVISAAIDLGLFSAVVRLFPNRSLEGLLAATVTARLASGLCNFSLNHGWVFRRNQASRDKMFVNANNDASTGTGGAAVKYLLLFCSLMFLSWLLVSGISALPLPLTFGKALVDTALFILSYHIQRRYVFSGAVFPVFPHEKLKEKIIPGKEAAAWKL